MLASSSGRVPTNTPFDANQKIRARFHQCVSYYRNFPEEIPERLKQLDREWDVERALAALSATFSLLGLAITARTGRRKYLAIPAVVQGFYMQHTLQGWCPPLPMLRRLLFRTAMEIEREKSALKEILRDRDPNKATTSGPGLPDPRMDFADLH
jgi:hypothetical protein